MHKLFLSATLGLLSTGLIVSASTAASFNRAETSPAASPDTVEVAQAAYPYGTFYSGEWEVTLDYYNNAMTYSGYNRYSGDSIYLSGASVGGSSARRTYTWRNGSYSYQVAWRPNDPGVIRLQVFAPNGSEVLNDLLYRG